jgi:hypothetical protein
MAGIGEKRRVRYPKVMFIEPQDLPQTTCIIVGLESFLFASVPFWTSRTIWENDRIHLTHCEYPPILFSKNWHGISVGNIHSWFVKNSRLSRKDVPFIQLNAILIMSWKHMKTPWPRPSWPFQVLKKRPSHWEHPLRRFHYALRQGGQGGFLASEIWWTKSEPTKNGGYDEM